MVLPGVAPQRHPTGADPQGNDEAPPPVGGRRSFDIGRLVRRRWIRWNAVDQWKLSPQAQEPVAFGLSMVKPCFSMVSTKSIVAPIR